MFAVDQVCFQTKQQVILAQIQLSQKTGSITA